MTNKRMIFWKTMMCIVIFYFLLFKNINAKEWTTFAMDNTHCQVNDQDVVRLPLSAKWTISIPFGMDQFQDKNNKRVDCVITDKYIIIPTSEKIYIYDNTASPARLFRVLNIKAGINDILSGNGVSLYDDCIYFITSKYGIFKYSIF